MLLHYILSKVRAVADQSNLDMSLSSTLTVWVDLEHRLGSIIMLGLRGQHVFLCLRDTVPSTVPTPACTLLCHCGRSCCRPKWMIRKLPGVTIYFSCFANFNVGKINIGLKVITRWRHFRSSVNITRWGYCLNATMITRWHYYIDAVMITRWRYCLDVVMITR